MDISENTTFIGNSATDGGGVTYSSACMSVAMPLSLVTQLGLAEVSVHGPIAKWTSVRTLLLLETQFTMVAVHVHAKANSNVDISGNATFNGNSAAYGGGISAVTNSSVNISGNTTFTGNSARRGGGGVHAVAN